MCMEKPLESFMLGMVHVLKEHPLCSVEDSSCGGTKKTNLGGWCRWKVNDSWDL